MNESSASAPAARTLPIDPAVAVALLFFVSGGAALLLETAAVRAFVDLFGSTAASLGAIGGAFLACLALGALALGPLADRTRRPMRLYAVLEAVACAGGLLALFVLARLDALADSFARAEVAGDARPAARLLVGFAVLVVPVGALGGTLPVLARVRRGLVGRAAAAGVLQAANALGGAAGAFLAGAFLLNVLGTTGTWRVAALLNGLVALVAALLARGADAAAPTSAPPSDPRSSEDDADDRPPLRAAPLIVASACIGFSLLASEVLLFRGLAQLIRGGHDSLGAVLAAFLLGGALGSQAGVLVARRRRRARDGLLLGLLLSVVAPVAALAWLRAGAQADATSFLHFGVSAVSWGGRLAAEFFGALLIAGPVAFALALPFPASCELFPGDERRFGRAVAWLSAAWTAGAAAGGLLAPSLLLPGLKLRDALLLCAALPVIALLLLEAAGRARMVVRRVPACLAAVGLLAALLLTPMNGKSVLDGPLIFTGRVAGSTGASLRAYNEDALANVAVLQRPDGMKLLAVNDQMALGGSGATRVEAMEAVIPALLHPGPHKALLLGVGAGITAAALRDLGVEDIDAVELLPLVRSALPFFEPENGGVARDPRVKIHTTDARAFVRAAAPETYDLIIGDLYFPWEPETGLLYTREHFERVRRLLKPGGIFCQWLPGHQLDWPEIGTVGRTFCDVFLGTTVWLARPDFTFPILALVASSDRLQIDVPRLTQRLADPARKPMLEKLGVADPTTFLSLYVGDEWFFRDHFDEKELNTADQARVEFRAARRFVSDAVIALSNRRRLFEVHEDVVGRMTRNTLEPKERARLQHDLDVAAKHAWLLFDARTHLLFAQANRSLPPAERRNDPIALEAEAFQRLGAALAAKPDHVPTLDLILALFKQQLEARDFAPVIEGVSALEEVPAIGVKPRLRNLRGMAFLMAACDEQAGRAIKKPLDFAVKDFRKAAELDPQLVEAQVSLGIALFLRGAEEHTAAADGEEARAVLRAAREKISAPDRPDGHGLPYEAEAILEWLNGNPAHALANLDRGPSTPWGKRIRALMVQPK
jgi:spermidine synthase